jgi:hypothetical protein
MTLIEAVHAGGPEGRIRRKGSAPWIWTKCFPKSAPGNGYTFMYEDAIAEDWEVKPCEVMITRSQLEIAVQSVLSANPPMVGSPAVWPAFTRELAKELGL